MFMTKKQAQLLLLAAGVLMLLFGLWRGEADTVFSKAIRLCMECVGLYSKSVPFLQPISSHIRIIVCLSITKCYLLFLYYLMIYTRIVSNRITRK